MSDNEPPIEHSDSIESQDPNNKKKGDKEKNRRPANTAFRQQRLKAWQPILTPKTVIPLFFAIGIIFAPLGGGLLYASAQVNELTIDYSQCANLAPNFPEFGPIDTTGSKKVRWFFKDEDKTIGEKASWSKQNITVDFQKNVQYDTTQCTLEFTIPAQMNSPVLFYYRLTNFYQNHRRYVKSFQADQLKGDPVSNNTIQSSSCTPLYNNRTDGKIYYPCGLIANSLFNDTFHNPVLLNSNNGTSNETYSMNSQTDIAWAADAELYGKTTYNYSLIAPPPNWIKKWPNGYSDDNPPINPKEDEAFQVWMRTAGLPTFSKLAQRNDIAPMKPGTYRLQIDMNFPVTEFGGTKSIVISTRTIMGGRNPFLGIAYVVVGGICVVLGAVFTFTHLVKPRKLGDHTYLSWNNEQPSTATTSGREIRPE